MVLRAYHRATHEGDFATAQGLLAWLAGQPHTDRSVLRSAGTRGKVDGQASLTFLAGLLQLLRQSGYGGLVVVLDEVETIQRMNSQTREKSLNALRHRVVVRRPALSTDLTRSEGVRLPGTDASMQVARPDLRRRARQPVSRDIHLGRRADRSSPRRFECRGSDPYSHAFAWRSNTDSPDCPSSRGPPFSGRTSSTSA